MTRLIDADALVAAIKNRIDEDKEIYPDDKSSIIFRAGMKNVIGIVKNQDTVDPVKHGHWEYLGERDGAHVFECSECYDRINTVNPNWLSKYCSGCGAKMLDMEE